MTSIRIESVRCEILLDASNPQLLVHVTDDGGLTGVGETWWGRYQPHLPAGAPVAPIAAMIDAILAPACVGHPVNTVGDIRSIWNQLVRETYQYGHEGIVSTAISGIDIALWDLVAQRRGSPVASLLGRTVHEQVRVYASLHWLGDLDAIVACTDSALAAGFRAIKLHESDAGLILAVREHLGPDVALMVDASAAFDEAGAHKLAGALETAGLTWLEEPIYPQRDHAALAALRARCSIPLAAGENEFSVVGFEQLINAEAVHIVQPEIAKFGGLTPAGAVGALISTAGLECCPHNYSLGPSWLAGWHWAFTEPSVTWLEVPWLPLGEVFPFPLALPSITDGCVGPPTRPGLAAGTRMVT